MTHRGLYKCPNLKAFEIPKSVTHFAQIFLLKHPLLDTETHWYYLNIGCHGLE